MSDSVTMILDLIRNKYQGNIRLYEPLEEIDEMIPEPLKALLLQANGIAETMEHPKTGELMEIGWILYQQDEMIRASSFFREEYGLEGVVFSDDGGGNPFYLLDGVVYDFDPIDNESTVVAGSLEEFFA